MSDAKKSEREADLDVGNRSSGLSLTLAYSLLAVAMVAAICIALFIVLPFYHRR
jgi:hypothetical protein